MTLGSPLSRCISSLLSTWYLMDSTRNIKLKLSQPNSKLRRTEHLRVALLPIPAKAVNNALLAQN